MESFVPHTPVLIWTLVLSTLRFENQRWTRARNRGLRGSSEGVGLFVDLTGALSIVFYVLFLLAYGYDAGWHPAVGLFVASVVGATLTSIVMGAIFRGDNLGVWMVSTIAIWPAAFFMSRLVTWFGLF